MYDINYLVLDKSRCGHLNHQALSAQTQLKKQKTQLDVKAARDRLTKATAKQADLKLPT
jgi:hypothetical protein